MFEVNRKALKDCLSKIGQAIECHDRWFHRITRVMVCKERLDPQDIADDAHAQCHFSRWYQEGSCRVLNGYPTFSAMEDDHKRLHELGAVVLKAYAEKGHVDSASYDQFIDALEKIQIRVLSLRHELETELYNLDPLTEAYTRHSMMSALREQQQMVARGASTCAVAMLDVDHFKSVNDQYGHKVGDQALANISSIMIKNLRPYDMLYRYGGEEFVIILPNITVQSALMIMGRIRKLIGNTPIEAGGHSVNLTVSIGVSMIDPKSPAETALDRADQAMYLAKQNSRNMVRLWEASSV